jgi:hypothetical protein
VWPRHSRRLARRRGSAAMAAPGSDSRIRRVVSMIALSGVSSPPLRRRVRRSRHRSRAIAVEHTSSRSSASAADMCPEARTGSTSPRASLNSRRRMCVATRSRQARLSASLVPGGAAEATGSASASVRSGTGSTGSTPNTGSDGACLIDCGALPTPGRVAGRGGARRDRRRRRARRRTRGSPSRAWVRPMNSSTRASSPTAARRASSTVMPRLAPKCPDNPALFGTRYHAGAPFHDHLAEGFHST